MSEMTHEEACEAVVRDLEFLGGKAAHRVMDRLVRHGHHPDLIPELVEDECEVFRLYLFGGRANPDDLAVAERVFRAALIKEGKQLAILFATEEEGTA